MDLKGKRVMMLEGNPLARYIIDKAHELGVEVIIANWYSVEDAPAKAYADKSIEVDIFDVPAMMDIVRRERIDGIFTAYTDSHLHIYQRLCAEAGLPCFTSEDTVGIMVDKGLFKEKCREAGLPVIEEYDAKSLLDDLEYARSARYPLIVKPADSSGARGISVCQGPDDVASAIERAKGISRTNRVIVERYLRGNYCLADFMIKDGNAHFCASSDKPANDDDKGKVNLPGAYIFPSVDNALIRDTLSGAVQRFVDAIGYRNGLLCLELINAEGHIHVIEAQFRLGAKFQELYLEEEYGIDQLKALLELAITGRYESEELANAAFREFQNCYACVNILLREGSIAAIPNPNTALSLPHVDAYIPMKKPGDTIKPDGSMVQLFGKASLSAPTRDELLSSIESFQGSLDIIAEDGSSMIISSLG